MSTEIDMKNATSASETHDSPAFPIAQATKLVPIDELKPYARNAKRHPDAQIQLLKQSIERYGFNAPVLISDGEIVAGHGRMMAARELGMTELPVVDLSHLTSEQAQEYRLADNKLTEVGGWDVELLRQELEEVIDRGVDFEALGFAPEDMMDPWKSDIEKIEREREHTDGIPGRIVITCDSFIRDEILGCLTEFKQKSGYEFTIVG